MAPPRRPLTRSIRFNTGIQRISRAIVVLATAWFFLGCAPVVVPTSTLISLQPTEAVFPTSTIVTEVTRPIVTTPTVAALQTAAPRPLVPTPVSSGMGKRAYFRDGVLSRVGRGNSGSYVWASDSKSILYSDPENGVSQYDSISGDEIGSYEISGISAVAEDAIVGFFMISPTASAFQDKFRIRSINLRTKEVTDKPNTEDYPYGDDLFGDGFLRYIRSGTANPLTLTLRGYDIANELRLSISRTLVITDQLDTGRLYPAVTWISRDQILVNDGKVFRVYSAETGALLRKIANSFYSVWTMLGYDLASQRLIIVGVPTYDSQGGVYRISLENGSFDRFPGSEGISDGVMDRKSQVVYGYRADFAANTGVLTEYDVQTMKAGQRVSVPYDSGRIPKLELSPDGKKIIASLAEAGTFIVDMQSAKVTLLRDDWGDPIAVRSIDSGKSVCVTYPHAILRIDTSTGEVKTIVEEGGKRLKFAATANDCASAIIAQPVRGADVGSRDQEGYRIGVVSVDGRKTIITDTSLAIGAVGIGGDAQRVFFAARGGIQVRGFDGLALEKTLPSPQRMMAMDASPDGSQLIVLGSEGDVDIWDVNAGKVMKTISHNAYGLGSMLAIAPYLVVSPNREHALVYVRTTVSSKRTWVLVNLSSGKVLGSRSLEGISPGTLDFGPNGQEVWIPSRSVFPYVVSSVLLSDFGGTAQPTVMPGVTTFSRVIPIQGGNRFALFGDGMIRFENTPYQ